MGGRAGGRVQGGDAGLRHKRPQGGKQGGRAALLAGAPLALPACLCPAQELLPARPHVMAPPHRRPLPPNSPTPPRYSQRRAAAQACDGCIWGGAAKRVRPHPHLPHVCVCAGFQVGGRAGGGQGGARCRRVRPHGGVGGGRDAEQGTCLPCVRCRVAPPALRARPRQAWPQLHASPSLPTSAPCPASTRTPCDCVHPPAWRC